MGYYRLLLVDDELEIRDGMVEKLDWNSLGFEIAGVAENGVEALELSEQVMPDVILTDIRMPFMDGLEFIEQVTCMMPAVKIVVFSGFDDFEYAQKAIKLGVEEYILKPISAKQLEESLIKLKKKMDGELAKKRDIAILRRTYEESYPILREQFLVNLIEGRLTRGQIENKLEQYGICIHTKFMTTAILSTNDMPLSRERKNVFAGKEELIPISLKQTVESILGKKHEICCFLCETFVVVIVGMEWESQISFLYQEINEACKEARRIIGAKVTAGIGGIYSQWEELKYSYQEARNALEYSAIFGKDGEYTAYSKDIEPEDTTVRFQLEEYEERTLINAVKGNNEEKIKEQIHTFFGKLEQSRLPFYQYQTYILEIFAVTLKLVNIYKLDARDIFGAEANYIEKVLGLHSLDQMQDWFTQICLKIGSFIQKERMDSGKHLVAKAKEYVEENYADASLSVEALCEELHVSPAYFSTVFKKETKTNFVAYVTDIRMEHAVQLLDTTEDKTYMIAAKVGYAEPNYFSYVFKKKMGMSPSKYRNRLSEG